MKTILLDLKTSSKTLLVFALFFIVSIAQGATRYSVASGNWNSTSTWSTSSGGASGASVPVAGDTVIIEKGFNVTVTADAACSTITFTTTTATSLTINSGITLTVSGAITIPRTATGKNLIAVGAGTLNAASIAFTSGGSTVNHEITISTGTVVVSGNITTNSTGISASITFTDAGLLKVGGQLLSSGTVGGTLTTVAGSTVEYTGGAQTAKVAIYNNLTLSGTGVKTFATTPTVNGVLSLEGTATVVATSGVVTYGSAATLQYNTATSRTASSEEWISSFAATGGIIIKNTGTITLNANKSFSSAPLTVKDGATLALSTFTLSSPSSLTLENGTSGSTITGTGLFTLGGNVTVNYTGSGTGDASISCPLALGSNRTFTVANDGTSAADLTLSGIVSTTNNLTKSGAGTMTMSAVNTYSGSTTVSAGTLHVTGSLSSSSSVSVASGAVLSGNGTAAGSVSLSGSMDPGASTNSIGTLTTGALTFNGGSSYTFDISNVAGTAGTNWDLLTSSGAITVSSTSGSPTTIYLVGNPTGFTSCDSYTWKIAGGTSVVSFTASDFVVNTSSFTPSFAGVFTVSNTGNDINLVYTSTSSAGAASSSPTLCINTALTAITHTTTATSGIGTATGLPAGVTAAWASNTITISGTPTASGTFNYSIPLTGSCGSANATGTIIVSPNKTATLSSAVGTNAQTLCVNNAITSITYTTTEATGKGTATGLPTGVTATWASDVLTISGTPTATGTFNYSIPLSGGCGTLSVTGTITVNANNSITLTSSSSTIAQSKCINTNITTINYSTISATGATFSGLPTGVSGTWAANAVTISGTPTVSSATAYTYTVTLTGGCAITPVTTSGSITVKAIKTATLTSAAGTNNQSACRNVAITPIKYATTGATGKGTSSGLPSGVSAVWASNVLTISGTPTNSGTYNYSIPLSGGCGSLSVTGTITVKSNGTITLTSATGTNAQTKCINNAITTIKYSTTSATGATITGLPTGVTGSWASNVVTISGTPTVSSAIAYTYVVSLTGVCGSATGTIKVNSMLNAGAIATTGQTICNGSVPNTIGSTTNATGGDGVITYKWQANGVDISNSNTSTYTPAALSTTTTFTRFAKDGMCNTTFVQSTGSYVVTVQGTPTSGAIAGGQTICSDVTPSTITSSTAGTATGTLSYRWEVNTDLITPSWATIEGATGATYSPSLLSSTTQFRRITVSTTNGVSCESTPTTAVQVTVNAAVAVELDYINDIAIGASSFTIPFLSTSGNPDQYSVTAVPYIMNGFTNVVNQPLGSSPIVVNTPTTANAGIYNFQVMVQNSTNGCQSGPYDFDVMVTGVSHGSIGSNQTICNGATPNTLSNTASATTSTGTISYTWEKSTVTANTGYTVIPGATSATYSPGPLTQTTYFKRVASNGLGDASDTTPITITVRSAFSAGAIATTGESVCYNGNPSLIGNVTAATGGDNSITYKWQANGVAISSNTATYDPPTGLTSTTTYVRLAKDNTCSTTYVQSTGSWVVTVNPVSIGGLVSGPSSACAAGTVGKVLTLTGNTGSIVRWESSVSPFTIWESINATTPTITTEPLTETTKFRAVVQSGACSQALSDVFTITLYTGSTTYVDGAWTDGEPDETKTATISSAYATAGTNVIACALVVNNNAAVVISSGDTLTLTEGLTVESGSLVTLNNDANLIQSGPINLNSGAIKVKRTSSALKRQDYTLWSSPVAGQNLLPFSPLTLTNRFYTYNPNTNLYDVVASPSTTAFDVAKGYLIRVPNNHPTTATTWTGTFTGVPNSGNYSMPIVYGGGNLRFNLVGNPYPSPINAVSFVNNATNYNSISGTIYFWRKTNNAAKPSYCTWTQGGFVHNGEAQVYDPNDVIQTGQGFFVEATGQGSTVEFDNSMRQENHVNQFFRSVNIIEKNRIWLNLTNTAGLFSQAMVGYITHATAGLDSTIDGKFINDGEIALTSLIEGTPYAIQGRGLPFHSTDVVPLNLKVTNAGSYTIAIDRVDGLFTNSEEIYLKDNLTGVVHNLRTSAYDFSSDAGNFDTRFEIVYQMPLSTTGKHEFNANQVVLYKDLNNSLIVNTGSEKMKSVKVFDIQGRVLLEQNNIDATQTALNINGSNEVILVQITTENGAVVTKKYILQRMTSKDEKLTMQKVQLAEDE